MELKTKIKPNLNGHTHQTDDQIDKPTGGLNLSPEAIDCLLAEEFDDYGHAQTVINYSVEKFLHSEFLGWLYWTGTHYRTEGADKAVFRAIQSVLLDRRAAAVVRGSEAGIKLSKPSTGRTRAVMVQLANYLDVRLQDFDADPSRLNCANGVVDLRTGAVEPHHPGQLFTTFIPFIFDPQADDSAIESHIIDTFIPEELHSNITTEYKNLLRYVQTVLGYCVTGETSEEIMFYLHGEKGRNGKGTIFYAMDKLLGAPTITTVPVSTLTRNRTGSDQNFDLARLKPSRLVVASETSRANSYLNDATIKQLTGRDKVTAAFKGKDHFEYEPAFKIIVQSNNRVETDPDDHAAWSRLHVLYCPNSYLGREDTQLKERLTSDEAMRGWLKYLVAGAMRWYRDFHAKGIKLPRPGLVEQWTNQSRLNCDTIGQFLDDCCILGNDYKVKATDLRAAYSTWCDDNGYKAKGARNFNKAMGSKGFVYKPQRDGGFVFKGFEGVKLG